MHTILRQLRRAALLSGGDGPSDAQLLEFFLSQRDQLAFEALVRRHGPMVLAVCRRVTGNAHDAEDAFQATFLVLVRKAASLRSGQLLPGWLYRIAYRTALNTRTMTQKRRAKEKQAAQQPRPEPGDDRVPEELLARLDEALNRLPDRYRLPVVLCELQGHSRKQAAELLGLPIGTVSWRLAHARKLLAQRLARYGTLLSAGAVAAVLSQTTATAVPAALVRAVTVQALAAGTIPAPIQALTEGVLKAMLLSKLKVMCGVALAAVVGIGAVGLMYRPAVAADPQQPGNGRAAARATADEIEELRLEIAAVRKGLQATRQRVKTLENEVATLRGAGAGPAGAGLPGGGSGMSFMDMMQQMRGGGRGLPGTSPMPKGPAGKDWQKLNQGSSLPPPRFGNGGDARPRQPQPLPDDSSALPRLGNGGSADAPTQGHKQPIEKPAGVPATSDARPGQKPHAANRRTGPAPSTIEAERRVYRQVLERANDALSAQDQANAAQRQLIEAYDRTLNMKVNQQHDPLAAAQAALKQLRNNPNDRQAAERLERALKRLEAERKKQKSGSRDRGPSSR